jgi:hypothetical protein
MKENDFKVKFATHPHKIIPQTEVIDALGQVYFSEYNDDIEEFSDIYWPLVQEAGTDNWKIDRKWVKFACEKHTCIEDINCTDSERRQCLHEEVQRVIGFLVELHEWCRLNQLAPPEDCDPNKWDMIPAIQREAIIEGLAANGVGTVFDPYDL